MADKTNEILVKFSESRTKISNEIRTNIDKMSAFGGLKEVQVLMLSLRQRLLEESHTLLEHLSVLRTKLRDERGKHMEQISNDLAVRYQYNEKTAIIDGKIANRKEMIDVLENQIAFFNDSIRTVDNVLYGIKTRVEIEKVLGI